MRAVVISIGLALAVLLAPGLTLAQQPAGDGMARPAAPAASPDVARGQSLYAPSCGFCHGAEGAGASGPPLVASPFITQDDKGASLTAFLKVGRPATGMPPFPGLGNSDVAAIWAFINSKRATARVRPPLDPKAILVGDAAAGRTYFNGAGGCKTCHSPTGDLKGVGTRFDPLILQGRMINPRVVGVSAAKPPPPAKVTVYPPRGAPVTGALVQINDFFVTLVDQAGVRRSFARDNEVPKVVVEDPLEAHRQMMLKWTDQNMWNVTAYLASLK